MNISKIKYLAIIPARKNSRRIKNKNLKKINNKDLVRITLESAIKSKKISKIALTTDSNTILKKFKKENIFLIKRPKKLSSDKKSTEEAIVHCLKYIENKYQIKIENVVLLQVTSPLRNHVDIDKAILQFEKQKSDSLFSGYEDKLFIWSKNKKKLFPLTYNIKKRLRTQNMKNSIVENGAIFIFNKSKFGKYRNRLFGNISCYVMSKTNSFEVDELEDLKIIRKISRI